MAADDRRRAATLAALGVLATLAAPAAGEEIRGVVRLTVEGGGRVSRGVEDSVVAFQPDRRVPVEVPETPPVMATSRKQFQPQVLIVPRGSEVRFPNFDPILHNVFSVSPGSQFDLGVYGRSDGASFTFERPGLVRIYCNVHRSMFAYVLVLDTPFYTRPDRSGAFRLSELPTGPGTLILWHPRGDFATLRVEPSAVLDDVEIEISRHQIPPHLDKFGRPYRAARDRYN